MPDMTDQHPVSPLLEFDPTPTAFIEPSTIIHRRDDVPDACVLTWFRDAAERVVDQAGGRLLLKSRWEDGPRSLYVMEQDGRPVGLAPMPVGAPSAAAWLEELIALGCSNFIACGGAGVLRSDLTLGHLVVVTSALRDEGTSHHYLPPARIIEADEDAVAVLIRTLEDHGAPHVTGRTWTTDGVYRETPERIAARTAEGCLTVEMEAAPIAAVARFRGVRLAQVLYGGDDLTGEEWDDRSWQSQHEIRDELIRTAADAALQLARS